MPQNLKHKITKFKEKGLLRPSSKKLAEKMVSTAVIKKRKVIVEFGSGTGVFTKEILKHKAEEALYFAIELNPEFVTETRQNCPGATVYEGSATNLAEYLKQNGVEKCDCIVSGLPFANFNEALQNEILETVNTHLDDKGIFLTFMYNVSLLTKAGKLFKEKLPNFFSKVRRTDTVWANLPPAFVFYAEK